MQKPQSWSGELPRQAAELLARLRERGPRVHCITNAVAQNFTANILLAAGCVPSMTISPEEVGQFVARAGALLVNLGTFDRERREAIEVAVAAAADNRTPWVLDPVMIDRSPPRADFARQLVTRGPKVLRLNSAEFIALSGRDEPEAIADYARDHACVVARSGATDFLGDGQRHAAFANGHPFMAKVTAMGCAGSALIAACLAVEPDAYVAAGAGLLLLGIAGELAARDAKGPGSFAVAIVDMLHALDGAMILKQARVS